MSHYTRFNGDYNIIGTTNSNVLVSSTNLTINGNVRISGAFVQTANAIPVANANDPVVVDTFSVASYRAVKYYAITNESTNYQINDVYLVHNNTAATILTTHTLDTGGNLGVFSANVDSGNVYVNFSAAVGSTTVKMFPIYYSF